jgi:branched-chain amino acid aminotransferase
MLNSQGRAACTTMGNIFAVVAGGIVTPPVAEGALPGIARQHLLARGLCTEAPLSAGDLARAEALFAANSLRLVRAAASLDGRPLASAASRKVEEAAEALRAAAGF